MREGIVLLGSGDEILYALKEIFRHGLVKAFGAHYSNIGSAQKCLEFCRENSIAIISSIDEAINLSPKFIFMVSYPVLIKKEHLDQCLFVNMHGALVPRYRGIHGGTWAMVNGEKQQGYTIHKVDEGIDSGPIYFQGKLDVGIHENINEIRQRILDDFRKNVGRVLLEVYNDEAVSIEQNEDEAIYVCRRNKSDSLIDWSDSSWNIHNLIRALTPPYTQGAFSYYNGEELYLTKSKFRDLPVYKGIPGQIVANLKGEGVLVKTGDSALLIERIIFQGDELSPTNFFRTVGYRLNSGQ